MIPFIWIFIIISICLLSSVFIYVLIHSRENVKSHENQRLKYSIQPSFNIITKKLPYHLNISNSSRRSFNEENLPKLRSHSVANNLFVKNCTNRRQSSIIDSKQIAQIEFSVPLAAEKYRRRSVAICDNMIECHQNTIDSIIKTMKSSNQFTPCLVSFSVNYLKSSQIKIFFHSLSLNIQLQQLTIKIKLIPDGKIKYLEIKKILQNENIFLDDKQKNFIQFSNISLGKFHEKAIVMKFYGKDQVKKTIHFGQIGKIYFNQLKNFHNENQIDFIHEIEIIKLVRKRIFSNIIFKNFLIVIYGNSCFTQKK